MYCTLLYRMYGLLHTACSVMYCTVPYVRSVIDGTYCPVFYCALLYWNYRSKWPSGHRRCSAAARLLRFLFRMQRGARISVCCDSCLLSRSGICDQLLTPPVLSYGDVCVYIWNHREWGCHSYVESRGHIKFHLVSCCYILPVYLHLKLSSINKLAYSNTTCGCTALWQWKCAANITYHSDRAMPRVFLSRSLNETLRYAALKSYEVQQ